MGCQCTKKNEISNMNLQDNNGGIPESFKDDNNLEDTVLLKLFN